MFRIFLRLASRNVFRNLAYVIINVTGLGLALAICIVAWLNYRFDRDFDKDQPNRDRIFHIEHTQLIDGSEQSFASTPIHLGPAASEDIPGIEKMTRITRDLVGTLIRAGENEKYAGLIYADPEIFDVFDFPLLAGNKESAHNIQSIFITQQLATFLFGDQDPLGKSIKVWEDPYVVAGVLENHPLNSSFQFEAVVPIQGFFSHNQMNETHWGNIYACNTFILTDNAGQAAAIEKSLQQYVPAVNGANFHQVTRFYLAPFSKMAHQGRKINGHTFQPSLHPAAVIPPAIAALCILLIACFNFAGTSVSMAGKRMREIGIKKVAGSGKGRLILQFIWETMLLMVFVFIMALFFAHFLVPAYSNMWEFLVLSFSLRNDPELVIFILSVFSLTAIGSCAYPAYYVSSFNPVTVLNKSFRMGNPGWISRGILILQFAIATLALYTWLIFMQNKEYQQHFDAGYDASSIIQLHGEDREIRLFREEIRDHPGIVSTSLSIQGPFFNTMKFRYQDSILLAKLHFLDTAAFRTLGLRILEGRPFEPETMATDAADAVIINKMFVDQIGMKMPVGERIWLNDTVPYVVVGIMENMLKEGTMTNEINPEVYRLADASQSAGGLCIRTLPTSRNQIWQYLEKQWKIWLPDTPFRAVEGDVYTEASLYIIRKILSIAAFLLLIAVILSVAGLYAQISLRISSRTREIGIRKAFGASVQQVIGWLNQEFMVLISLGAITGILCGCFLNKVLINSIWNYFPTPDIMTFMLPVLFIFFIAVITVSGKVYHAATRNPARTLKYE
ncbi:MAG: ABC transporter permease [Bacteroidales bacterium]